MTPSGEHSGESSWCVLSYVQRPGAWQMAADLYLYRRIADQRFPFILRFYQFLPPTVSLGYHQTLERAVDLAACTKAGIDVVRRPTGGRALLHRNEINYSVIIDLHRRAEFATGFKAAFTKISEMISAGLLVLGVRAERGDDTKRPGGTRPVPGGGVCASSTTAYEIDSGGRKVVAAAQLVSANRLLQHGTIYLREAEIVPTALFRGSSVKNANHMIDLWSLLSKTLTVTEVQASIVSSFTRTLGESPQDCVIDPIDLAAIEELAQTMEDPSRCFHRP